MGAGQLRIFEPAERGPAENMAMDEALFLSLIHGGAPPFIRFYRWAPPTLSFGYFQKIERLLNQELAKKSGLGIVRRASGGKMVFHADEWTFSLAMPGTLLEKANPKGDFLRNFQSLMEPLVNGLQQLGLNAELRADTTKASTDRIHCYSANVGHSVFLGDRKLIGAAGVAKEGSVLIHGSIPISLPPVLPDVFFHGVNSETSLGMACLSERLSPTRIAEIPAHLTQSFGQAFSLELAFEPLSSLETQVLQELARKKYADVFWSQQGVAPMHVQIKNLFLVSRGKD